MIAGAVAVVLVGVGVVVVRDRLLPPEPSNLGITVAEAAATIGGGQLTLGMAASDFQALLDRAGEERQLLAYDEVNGCERYASPSNSPPFDSWVWVRDATVVTIGVEFSDVVDVGFGPTVNGLLDRDDPDLRSWTWDDAAPVPVARLVDAGEVATLADTDANGQVDFVSVGMVQAEECEVPAERPPPATDSDAPAIVGASLLGASIGMSSRTITALSGWRVQDPGGCSVFSARGSSTAYVRDVVVGIEGTRTSDGVMAGQTVDEAVAALGAERVEIVEPSATRYRGEIELRVDDGRILTVSVGEPSVVVEGLDVVASPPRDLRDRVVTTIRIGETCNQPVGP